MPDQQKVEQKVDVKRDRRLHAGEEAKIRPQSLRARCETDPSTAGVSAVSGRRKGAGASEVTFDEFKRWHRVPVRLQCSCYCLKRRNSSALQ